MVTMAYNSESGLEIMCRRHDYSKYIDQEPYCNGDYNKTCIYRSKDYLKDRKLLRCYKLDKVRGWLYIK